jgi:hypothetical protein
MTIAKGTRARKGRPPRQALGGIDLDALSNDETLEAIAAKDVALPQIERPAMRPIMREEDPRAAAARRAAEIRSNQNPNDDGVDEFKLPPAPDGWTYEWKTKAVLGQVNHAHLTELKRQGWDEVPTARHPEEMPYNTNDPVIERKGMILMQRPTVIVEESRMLQDRKARAQVKFKEEQLAGTPEGGLGHRNHEQARPRINKGYEPIPVPRDS